MYPILVKDIKKIKEQPLISMIYLARNNTKFAISVNETALEILFLCDGTNSLEDMKNILMKKYNEKYNVVSDFVDEFINDSVKIQNIILSDTPVKQKHDFKYIGNKNYWTPDMVCIELTHSCPLKCKHCFLDAGAGEMINNELLERICKEAIELGVELIQLTGGEPLLHPKVFDIIDYILENNTEVHLFTSGFLCDSEILSKLEKYKDKKLVVQISIDGLEEHHNEFRGNENSFKNALKLIKFLTSNNIQTVVGTCITEQSYDEIDKLCSLLKELGVNRHRISTISERGRSITNNLVSSGTKIKKVKDIKKLLSEKYNSDNFKVMYNEEQEIELNLKYIKNCGMGQTMLKIDPKGDVYPCVMCDRCTDTLINKSLKTILEKYSNDFSKIEKPHNKYCSDCNSKDLCNGCIIEGLLYGAKHKDCKWYTSQKHIIDKVL
ncbi:TPA: radical SAM protein [Clostridium botulinum]|nr:radical SAM protein [Clostridium botulinum]